MFLLNGRAGVIDLSTGESSKQALPEETLLKGDAVAVARGLIEEHGDAIVLGTGLLTGSLVPAACAGLVSTSVGTSPMLGFAGVELKLAGFDFLVVKGASARPGYVWVRDGIAEFVESPDLRTIDSWARTDRVRADQGDRRIQVVAAGPWGDAQRPVSPLVVSHWLGEDDLMIGREFGRRNLAAVAFRGMGELEVSDPEGHLSACVALRAEHSSRLGTSEGMASYWPRAGEADLSSLVHRHVACFGCPHPCRSFLKVNEDPRQMAFSAGEPGYLHFDIASLEAALESGMGPGDATRAFMECAKAGADPLSVIRSGAGDIESVRRSIASGEVPAVARTSAAGSFASYPTFARCVGLGLCPRYYAKAGLDADAISGCAEPALGAPLR